MEASFLSEIRDLRPLLYLLIGAAVAGLFAAGVHHLSMLLLRKLARQRPFILNLCRQAYRGSLISMILFAVRIVFASAPDRIPWLAPLSQLFTLAFIAALTWLGISCVDAAARTVTQLNPVDVDDNLKARRLLTQTRVLARSAHFAVLLLGLSFMLLSLPGAREFGTSLLASAGIAGVVAGIAARPILTNFIAGLQIAFSQPIRIDDVLIVKGEWGRVEEITGTFVIVRIWDERRMIVPLQWFIENPFENWTRQSTSLLGTVFLWLDFTVPVTAIREEFERICHATPLWDGRVCSLHVTDTNEHAMQLRLLASAYNAGQSFELRCLLREQMLAFISQHYPDALPRIRNTISQIPFDSKRM